MRHLMLIIFTSKSEPEHQICLSMGGIILTNLRGGITSNPRSIHKELTDAAVGCIKVLIFALADMSY